MMNELCLFDRLLEDEQQSQSSLLDETAWVSTEGAGTSEDILDSTLTQCGIKESTNIDMDKVFGNNTDAFLDSLLAESDVSKLGCFTSELEEVTATISDTSSDSGRLVGDHSNHVMLSTQPEEDSTSSNGSNSPQHTPEGFEVVTQSVPESLRPIQVVTVPSGGTTTVTPIRIAGPNKSVSVKQINPAARLATAATTTIMLPVMNIRQTKATVNTTSPPSKRRRISASSSSDSGLDDVSSITSEQNNNASNNKYPPLILNDEEKRLCEREGVRLPSHYPLSREEEKNLKRIRRKIRNKVSAQDSRKRKKEYVEAMESRVKKCEMEKDELHKKMELLEMQNKTLAGQVRRLHQIIVNGGGFRNSQASTAMMVLLLSTALFLIPGLKEQMQSKCELDITQAVKMPPIPGQSRSLLHTPTIKQEIFDDNTDKNKMETFVNSEADKDVAASPMADHDYSAGASSHSGSWRRNNLLKFDKIEDSLLGRYLDEDAPPMGYGPDISMDEVEEKRRINVTSGKDTRTVVLHVPKDLR